MSGQVKNRTVGMALWLLGGRLIDRVEWVVRHDMGSVALLQSIMQADPGQRAEAAAAIREAGLLVTYHGNVQNNLRPDGWPDEAFVGRMNDDVLWWHQNAGGVRCCCSDPLQPAGPDGARRFDPAINEWLVRRLGEGLGTHGILVGIENSFGPPACYQSVEDVRRFAAACTGVPGLAMLLDTGHVNVHLGGRAGLGEYVRQLSLPIAEVHVTDNRGQQDEHRHLGYGTLDVRDLAAALGDVGYGGPLTIEVCVDILNGKYAADLSDSHQTEPILLTRERLREVWA